MPVDRQYFNIYRGQLSSLYHGLALWQPHPIGNIYNRLSIGDVGFVREGVFYRMFNVTLPWDHPSNARFGELTPYKTLVIDRSGIRESTFPKGTYVSRLVSTEYNAGRVRAAEPDE